MKIITAYDKNLEWMANNLIKSAKGHKVKAYELGKDFEVAENDFVDFIKKCTFKPLLIKKVLGNTREPFAWIDVDCLIVGKLDIKFNFDLGVTMRRKSERDQDEYSDYSGWINAGVIFINNTLRAKRLVEEWIEEIPNTKTGTDQEALSNLVRRRPEIKAFTTDEYNFFYFPEEPGNAKILHFKGDTRPYYNEYLTKI